METPASAIQTYGGEDFLESDHVPHEDQASVATPASESKSLAPADLRQRGDVKLYKYYLGTVRYGVLLPWLFFAVMVVALEKLPGMVYHLFCTLNYPLNLCSTDIYVRIWVDKAPENKSLILGYAILGIAAMASVVPWFW